MLALNSQEKNYPKQSSEKNMELALKVWCRSISKRGARSTWMRP